MDVCPRLQRTIPPTLSIFVIVFFCLVGQTGALVRPLPSGNLIGPGGTKFEISFGSCLLHLYESCSNSRLLFYYIPSLEKSKHFLFNSSDAESLDASGFNSSRPTKLLIHGYNGSLYYEPIYNIARTYLGEVDVNVVVLDWRAYSNMPCYPSSVLNTWQAGRCTAHVLQEMATWTGAPRQFFADLHIIGFSLGAHVAGFASAYLKPFRIGRITGLDPALPFFASLSRSWKLDANDARFVDVIHTNVGVFGKIDNTGHADFYVNGGSVQPACNNSLRPLCNHLLAPSYFAESISTKARGFYGYPCQSFLYYVLGWCDERITKKNSAVMGEYCPKSTRGVFFVNTASQYPFSLGQEWPEESIVIEANTAEELVESTPTTVFYNETEETTTMPDLNENF
ncbi:pancreatic lipase-related protein 2-like [Neocloeon triangulifer]|uniref:pancreatic lipase-related protein 2-like n=1 Tax=Neocloeon triangulifer TaxID=2078957 RepID=UPI00286F5B06|nr:pancreatic lipase-related protein 2-like [Neocloeon triangulifer]